MIRINHIIIVLFLFLLFNNGIKSLEKVLFICLSIFIVYFFVSNNIVLDKLIDNTYNLDNILKKLNNYDKINVELISNDIKFINNNVKNDNKYIRENIEFLKNRINKNLSFLYFNYRKNNEIDNLIKEINNFINKN